MVAPNAWWPAPPLHLQLLYLQQLRLGMSCLNSPIPSSAWAHFPTKTAQLSLNKQQLQSTPGDHPILSGLQDETGLHLWHFPLTTAVANPQDTTGATALWPPILTPSLFPLQPPPNVTQLPQPSPVVIPPTVSAATHPHPSQGILATDRSGVACLVYYLYGAAQAVALAARTTGTPFDPCSLDLPSIGALVGFYHACLGFPVKQTWLDAIKAGNCNTFDGLTYSNAARYCPDPDETIMGHLAQQHQNVRSTKPKPTLLAPLGALPPPVATLSNQVFVVTKPLSKLFTVITGHFLVRARSGNQYVMIAFHTNGNLILQQAFKSKSDRHCIAAYNTIITRLGVPGLSVDPQILDTKSSSACKEEITFKWNATFQLIPQDMHRRSWAEHAICMFKDHFLAILAIVDAAFPPYLWDLLLPQAELTLNLLLQATLNLLISAWELFQRLFDFYKTPLGPVNCHALIHAKPLGPVVVVSSSMLSQHLAGLGTSVPRMVATLVQPWSCTAASNLSKLTLRVKLSLIQLNSAIPTFPSLHCPQRIKLSMAFRLLPEPSQGRRLPQVSPRWIQLPTFETSLNLGICSCNRPSCPCVPHCLAVQVCPPMNLQG
jgi:hypothetical protein